MRTCYLLLFSVIGLVTATPGIGSYYGEGIDIPDLPDYNDGAYPITYPMTYPLGYRSSYLSPGSYLGYSRLGYSRLGYSPSYIGRYPASSYYSQSVYPRAYSSYRYSSSRSPYSYSRGYDRDHDYRRGYDSHDDRRRFSLQGRFGRYGRLSVDVGNRHRDSYSDRVSDYNDRYRDRYSEYHSNDHYDRPGYSHRSFSYTRYPMLY